MGSGRFLIEHVCRQFHITKMKCHNRQCALVIQSWLACDSASLALASIAASALKPELVRAETIFAHSPALACPISETMAAGSL